MNFLGIQFYILNYVTYCRIQMPLLLVLSLQYLFFYAKYPEEMHSQFFKTKIQYMENHFTLTLGHLYCF